jgi:CTP:molybdopterin cytidylyltransferase MocA
MPDQLLIAILAAGASRRLGRAKQLVEVEGEPLVRRQCKTAIAADIGPVALILGCHHGRIAPLVSDLAVEIFVNEEWEEGMAASVRAATRAAMAAGAAGLLLYHCDHYAVTAEDLIRLHQAWTSAASTAHLSRDGRHLGPPAILPSRLFPAMLKLAGDMGPRALLAGDGDVREVISPSASLDLDRPDDLMCLHRAGHDSITAKPTMTRR